MFIKNRKFNVHVSIIDVYSLCYNGETFLKDKILHVLIFVCRKSTCSLVFSPFSAYFYPPQWIKVYYYASINMFDMLEKADLYCSV